MNRINQAALVETANQVAPEGLTWIFSGDVPDTITKELFKSIKWLESGKPIHGDEVSLPSPVTLKEFQEKFEQNRLRYYSINNRRDSYPSIIDQLDMLWHAIDNGTLDKTCDFYLTIKRVKDEFPKP